MKRSKTTGIAVTLIGLVLFNAIAFLIPFSRTITFWIGYGFAMIALCLQAPLIAYAFKKGDGLRSKLYGFPVARLSVIYLIIQLVLSLVVMAFSRFIPAWIPAIVFILVLGFTAIGLISVDSMRNEIVRQDETVKKSISRMKNLYAVGAGFPALTDDAELKQELEAYADELHYADPVSAEALEDVETELESLTKTLKQQLENHQTEDALTTCRKARSVLRERNRLCLANK